MCVLNELIDLMVYTPDTDYNSLLGNPDPGQAALPGLGRPDYVEVSSKKNSFFSSRRRPDRHARAPLCLFLFVIVMAIVKGRVIGLAIDR
jgi:hypothetical protein